MNNYRISQKDIIQFLGMIILIAEIILGEYR